MAEPPDLPTPTPISELDEQLKSVADETIRLLKRIIMVMGIAMAVLIVVAGALVQKSFTERSRVDSYLGGQCPFFYPVAVLPVPPSTSELGVDLVEGARTALARQACPEKIPPPSSELLLLGRKYHIPITY